ncbi:hypothetical protein N9E60_02155 [Schleiferiaceae bacterium]|jgi:hypothetical protein|nr:hypothetical protein [Bacteroidota bacterium]MDB0037287.1 hypothetical protein [Schleiferiaceae bacterium]|tara:strand:- start:304 stop:750 length:447 start_codon:yes stop_codon:yes gene_type:complete
MKDFFRLSLIGIFLLTFYQSTCQVVGALVDNEPVFTVDTDALIANYNANMHELSGLEVRFTSVEIVQVDTIYYLVFYNNDITTRSSLAIELSGRDNNLLNVQGGTSCTTSDCSSSNTGCVPRLLFKGCTPCENEGKCTRTSSNYSLIE